MLETEVKKRSKELFMTLTEGAGNLIDSPQSPS